MATFPSTPAAIAVRLDDCVTGFDARRVSRLARLRPLACVRDADSPLRWLNLAFRPAATLVTPLAPRAGNDPNRRGAVMHGANAIAITVLAAPM
ncbi:hypothetical protein BURK1_00082 [Burkholderiales bacterium]|nr:hypothetical protein BURK1_00082 [Burkholderiales bacterium]